MRGAMVFTPYLTPPLSTEPCRTPAKGDSSPFSPPRSPRTRSIELYVRDAGVKQYKRNQAQLAQRGSDECSERKWLREAASADRTRLITDEQRDKAEENERDDIVTKNRPEPPGVPISPRPRIGPRDARAVLPKAIQPQPNVVTQIAEARAALAARERAAHEELLAMIMMQKQKAAFSARARSSKQEELVKQAGNLTARATVSAHRSSVSSDTMTRHHQAATSARTASTAAESKLKDKIAQHREHLADARVQAWKVQISSGAEVTRWNEPRIKSAAFFRSHSYRNAAPPSPRDRRATSTLTPGTQNSAR